MIGTRMLKVVLIQLLIIASAWAWSDFKLWVWRKEVAAEEALLRAQCDREYYVLSYRSANCRCRGDSEQEIWHWFRFLMDRSGTVRMYVYGCREG